MNEFLYIGIGKDMHFYTLRHAIREVNFKGDYHLGNLAQNANDAFDKAVHAASMMGLTLITERNQLEDMLNEIKRRTAEQMAEAARKEAQHKADNEAFLAKVMADQVALVQQGIMPIGHQRGKAFTELTIAHLNWLVDSAPEESILAVIAHKIKTDYSELLLPKPDPDKHLDVEKGQRVELELVIIRSFGIETAYGYSNVVQGVDPTGVCVVQFGAWAPKVGDKVRVKATVKGFDVYKGQAQTLVNRVKEL